MPRAIVWQANFWSSFSWIRIYLLCQWYDVLFYWSRGIFVIFVSRVDSFSLMTMWDLRLGGFIYCSQSCWLQFQLWWQFWCDRISRRTSCMLIVNVSSHFLGHSRSKWVVVLLMSKSTPRWFTRLCKSIICYWYAWIDCVSVLISHHFRQLYLSRLVLVWPCDLRSDFDWLLASEWLPLFLTRLFPDWLSILISVLCIYFFASYCSFIERLWFAFSFLGYCLKRWGSASVSSWPITSRFLPTRWWGSCLSSLVLLPSFSRSWLDTRSKRTSSDLSWRSCLISTEKQVRTATWVLPCSLLADVEEATGNKGSGLSDVELRIIRGQ